MNYCTGWFDGVWGHCCRAHDEAYALGLPKIAADLQLGECVAATGNDLMGAAMALATALFGLPWYLRARRKRKQ